MCVCTYTHIACSFHCRFESTIAFIQVGLFKAGASLSRSSSSSSSSSTPMKMKQLGTLYPFVRCSTKLTATAASSGKAVVCKTNGAAEVFAPVAPSQRSCLPENSAPGRGPLEELPPTRAASKDNSLLKTIFNSLNRSSSSPLPSSPAVPQAITIILPSSDSHTSASLGSLPPSGTALGKVQALSAAGTAPTVGLEARSSWVSTCNEVWIKLKRHSAGMFYTAPCANPGDEHGGYLDSSCYMLDHSCVRPQRQALYACSSAH